MLRPIDKILRVCFLLFAATAVLADETAAPAEKIKQDDLLTAEQAAEQKQAESTLNPSELVDGLNQANLQEAFRLLRSEYIKKEELDFLTLNRAAMQGLLERLDSGATLLSEAQLEARNSPYEFFSKQLDTSIGYLRFGQFEQSELAKLDQAITDWKGDEAIKTMILDLRSPQAQADFAIAAEILSRFRPPNELLFKIRRPGNDRAVLFPSESNASSWVREVVVLIDQETGNVGEIIAAVLKRKNDSLLVGAKTQGQTVEYRDVPIGEDRILRYAIAEVILEDESSIFQVGVDPDLPADASIKSKHAIYAKVDEGEDLDRYIFRLERPRYNEAALVAGTNPELDYQIARSNRRKTEWDELLPEDRVLQKTVDVLRSRDFLDLSKRKRRKR